MDSDIESDVQREEIRKLLEEADDDKIGPALLNRDPVVFEDERRELAELLQKEFNGERIEQVKDRFDGELLNNLFN